MSLDIWLTATQPTEVFSANYTHNVSPMWRLAGVYEALYESDGKTAAEVLPALEQGFRRMAYDPASYEALNPKNKWGDYASALVWLAELMAEFRKNPDAVIGVSK